MKLAIHILAVTFSSLAALSAAMAATPKVAGKYASLSHHICQTVFVAPAASFEHAGGGSSGAAITSLTPNWLPGPNKAGIISATVGTVTFPNTPASAGNATVPGQVEVIGHSSRFPSDGTPSDSQGFQRTTNSAMQATFTLTATTVKFGTDTYDASFGNIQSNGVAFTVNLIRRPAAGEYCLDTMTLTHQ